MRAASVRGAREETGSRAPGPGIVQALADIATIAIIQERRIRIAETVSEELRA